MGNAVHSLMCEGIVFASLIALSPGGCRPFQVHGSRVLDVFMGSIVAVVAIGLLSAAIGRFFYDRKRKQ